MLELSKLLPLLIPFGLNCQRSMAITLEVNEDSSSQDYNKGNNIENNISHCAFLRIRKAPARKPSRSPKAVIVYPSYTYPSRMPPSACSQIQNRCTVQVPALAH